MEIKKVPAHRNNFYHAVTPKIGIVYHWIVGELDSADRTFQSPLEGSKRRSAHFGIGSNGEIHQYVSDKYVAYHAGNWGKNLEFIGIEHAGGQKIGNIRKTPTEACHKASAELSAYLAKKHGFKLEVGKTALPHSAIKPTQCCGTLDYKRIVRMANDIINSGGNPVMTEAEKWNEKIKNKKLIVENQVATKLINQLTDEKRVLLHKLYELNNWLISSKIPNDQIKKILGRYSNQYLANSSMFRNE